MRQAFRPRIALACIALAGATLAAPAPSSALTMTVAIEPLTENANQAFVNDYLPFARHLSASIGQPVAASLSRELAREIVATRSGSHDIIMGPAHVVASAVRYGYVPIASLPWEGTTAFVTRAQSKIRALEDLKGKKIGLPSVESLTSFIALGELNARKLLAKDAGVTVIHYRFHDVALYALNQGFVDAVAIDGELAKASTGDSALVVYFESPSVRRFNIAANMQMPVEMQVRLRDSLLSQRGAASLKSDVPSLAGFKPLSAGDFAYINKLTYLTPTFLPGATVISADKVAELIKSGVTCLDVRTEAEYKTRHISGAKFLPYAEHSKKEVGFDRSLDKFALADTVKDKNAPIIFSCNGEECWKSYKAATWALVDGYKTVYWFRGGFPEWRNRRFPLD